MTHAVDTYLLNLNESLLCSLRRSAEETHRLSCVLSDFDRLRSELTGVWMDVKDVNLVHLQLYIVRRVSYTTLKRKTLKGAEPPVLVRWTNPIGWVDVTGYLRSSTASLDGIQVLV